ncbi:NF-kappa-B-repressing factor isoform X2 [Nerophis lumbriciformis]|uniref:NF-kappa-B-repressing factor isoform X2 n=1 Tax=Nerophis lumbriciformis TaxID=546530 RepID=UPI002ADFCFFE|nr:NF-kappa-B-repressing factor-like isoform X2 [Nerophis lumbriciformis]
MDRWNGRPGCDQKVPGMERWTASGEMLPFDPYFSSEARKRPIFCDEKEPMRKMPMPEFGSWHGFEPVHFVSSGGGAYGADEKGNDKEPRRSDPYAGWDREYPHASHSSSGRAQRSFLNPAFDQVQPYTSDSWGSHRDRGSERNSGASFGGAVGLGYGGHGSSSNLMTKIQQEYSNKYDARSSQNLDMYSQPHSYNEYGRGNRPDSGRQGLGYDHQDPQSSTRPHNDHQDPLSSTRPHNRASTTSQLGVASQPLPISQGTLVEKKLDMYSQPHSYTTRPHNDHQDPQSSTRPHNRASTTSQLGVASQPLPISQGTLVEKKLDMYSQPHSYATRPHNDHQDPQSSIRPHNRASTTSQLGVASQPLPISQGTLVEKKLDMYSQPHSYATRPHNDHQDPQSSTRPHNRASATSQLGVASQPLPISQGTLVEKKLDMYSQPHSYNEYGRGNRPDSGRQGLGYDHQDPQSSTRPHKDHQDPQSSTRPHKDHQDPQSSTRPHNDHQDPQSSTQPLNQASATSQLGGASQPLPISQGTLLEKKKLIASLASALTSELKDPQFVISTNTSNYSVLLSRSIQTCKTNPQYTYVNLKDIPQADLPKNRKVPAEGYACELRFQGVYLATGYSGSKNGARDRASECAVKLFMKPVTVCTVSRKYYHTVFNDLVVRHRNCFTPSFPPALGKPENIGYPSFKGPYEPDMTKHWTEFVVQENAQDAICILNNSAAFCHMKVDYKFEQLPNASWLCSVYVQDEMVAQATGNKKSSKHFAAVDALERLRKNQASRQPKHPHQKQQQQKKPQETWKTDMSVSGWQFRQRGSKNKHLSELVIFENSDNAICIINDTAQFNKIPADYKFTREPDDNWKCEVFLAGQFVASAVGAKKQVKHTAAEEALATLKQTQAVVKSNLRKDGHNDSISRSQIMGRSDEEAIKQEIKEDNIGNQLLRKMGWKGGGLGRDGEGIAEPIRVKKQFSREGLGLDSDKGSGQLSKQDIEDIIRNYVRSGRQDDLRFASDLTNEERKQIHQMSLHYGLRSKSYGQGSQRFLVVSRKVDANQLIGQLLQEGQVGRYELVKPQASD